MRVEFRVLGTIDLRAIEDGHAQPLDLPPKIRALLAYLALERPRRLHARDTVTALFWPELDEDRARSNLRRALYVLRGQLGSEALITRGQDEVGLDRERFWCDAVAFDERVEEEPESALALYRGELLPAVHLDDSAEFERWLETERTRVQDRALAALGEVAGRAESEGRLAEAVRWQRKALEIDPFHEGALRRLMMLRARLGDRAGALQAYEAFERRLGEDLELEPDDETRGLAESVRAGEIAVEKPTEIPTGTTSQTTTPNDAPTVGEIAEPGLETGPSRERRRIPRAGMAVSLVVAVAIGLLLFLTGREDPRVTDPVKAIASGAAPGIAVVPFRVSGPSLELWREGMVDLLSKNLDGAAGLRAISSRTVMARWREATPEGEALDLPRTLEVARRAGGEYAVVGSAIALGPDIRMMADVYGLEDRAHLGQARVEGSPDSVFALVDRLSVGLLRTIVGSDEEIPSPRLASVTTSSLPALKAFLEGERLYRRGQFDEAVDSYKRAVTADSAFALAHFRYVEASGWVRDSTPDWRDSYQKVREYREKLSQRDAELFVVWATPGYRPGYRRDVMRSAVRKYPDDPEAWYLLGDILFHSGGRILADNDEVEAVFERAVALDPTFVPYWKHLLHKAFLDADTARAASVMATLDRLDPRALQSADRFSFTIAFGDSLALRQALAGIDTLSDDVLAGAQIFLQHHPGTFAAQEDVLREQLSRTDGQDPMGVAHLLALRLIRQGKRSAALEQLADPRVPSSIRFWDLYYMSIVGLQPPAELLESAFESFEEPRPFTPTRDWFWGGQRSVLVLSAAYAADRGHWPRHASILRSLRQFAREYAAGDAPDDSTNARILLGTVRALEGYGLWRRGHPERALSLLEAGQQEHLPDYEVLHWWLGRLLLELDRPADALRYFEALRLWERDPFAAFEAARIHEQLGDKTAALEGYEYALAAWRDADPVLRPRVEAARAALRRLSGAAD